MELKIEACSVHGDDNVNGAREFGGESFRWTRSLIIVAFGVEASISLQMIP